MKLHPRYPALALFFAFLFHHLFASPSLASDREPLAIASVLRSLAWGKSVMTISLRPGEEDFALQASLRLGHGVELTSLYITNGESIPSDCEAEASPFLVGRRKEEANAAMTVLGAQAFFLNNPDPGAVNARSDLDKSWRSHTVRRLTAALRYLHPHVVIIMSNRRAPGAGRVVEDLVSSMVKEAVERASKSVSVATDDNYGSSAVWEVQRVWTRSPFNTKGIRVDVDKSDGSDGEAYGAIGNRARGCYRSLRSEMSIIGGVEPPAYVPFWPSRSAVQREIDGGVRVVTPRFAELEAFIHGISRLQPAQKRELIARSAQAIDSLDRILGTQATRLNELDKHTLVRWKMALEKLRLLALDVKLRIAVSDSIIAQRQVFFVNVTRYDSSFAEGNTTIYFSPKDQNDWYVNEKRILTLPLRGPEQFRVLSAQELDLNYPVYRYGLASPTVTVPFSYGVYHYESNRTRRYVANLQVPLRYTRTRIIEIATPVVLWGVDKEISYRAFNASRDSSKGVFRVYGTGCISEPETVFVRKKDEFLEGSIKISWTGEPPMTLDTLEVRTAGRLFGMVFVKNMPVVKDSARRIVFVTSNAQGAVGVALRRMYPNARMTSPAQAAVMDLSATDVVLVDRLAFDEQVMADKFSSTVIPWVQRGGSLLVLPQKESIVLGGTSFAWDVSFAPSTDVVLNAKARELLNTPNPISEKIWKEWVYARAWCAVHAESTDTTGLAISTKNNGRLLLRQKVHGEGAVISVALNLEQQMENLHDGAFELFVNLLNLKPRKGGS